MRKLDFSTKEIVVATVETELGKFEIKFRNDNIPFKVHLTKPTGECVFCGFYTHFWQARNEIEHKHPEILFKTEDGVDVTISCHYWIVAIHEPDVYGPFVAIKNSHNNKDLYFRFSTKEIAEDFCKFLKDACISIYQTYTTPNGGNYNTDNLYKHYTKEKNDKTI